MVDPVDHNVFDGDSERTEEIPDEPQSPISAESTAEIEKALEQGLTKEERAALIGGASKLNGLAREMLAIFLKLEQGLKEAAQEMTDAANLIKDHTDRRQ